MRVLGINDDLAGIRPTAGFFKPHIVFNLMEAFAGVTTFDQNVVSYLELLRLPLHRLQSARPDPRARQGAVEEAARVSPHSVCPIHGGPARTQAGAAASGCTSR